jgi:hypothetical protein
MAPDVSAPARRERQLDESSKDSQSGRLLPTGSTGEVKDSVFGKRSDCDGCIEPSSMYLFLLPTT